MLAFYRLMAPVTVRLTPIDPEKNQPTNQPTKMAKGGDFREAQVDVPRSVWPFLRVTALVVSLTDT
jgi:hypothetical protein